jgi:erythromycin esterase-like protein
VAVEADWPDAYRVNSFVRAANDDEGPDEALSGFRRFPTWMWCNTVVADFVRWLREHNVVWAHNSHLGDARATELGQAGELNLGQLVRERHGRGALLVGFSTYTGTVTAASDWGSPAERKHVRPALAGSWEESFHEMGAGNVLLGTGDLRGRRLQRAIGVVYRPETERMSHYFHARVAEQFDAILHYDETRAVEPLERTAGWERGEAPDTFPTGL